MSKNVLSAYKNHQFEQGIAILEKNFECFPDKQLNICYNLALLYGNLEKYNEGLKYLNQCLDTQIWFNKWAFTNGVFKEYNKLKQFQLFLDRNEEIRLKIQKNTKSIFKLNKPENYDQNIRYPLFIALHGGGGNIESFEKKWTSNLLKEKYLVLYIQSSQIISMTGFNWEDMECSKQDIFKAINHTLENYPIDSTRIIIGGFSIGGAAAFEAINSSEIPIKGFITLCQTKPDSFDNKFLTKLKNENVRGSIITNPKDPGFDQQVQIVKALKDFGIQYQFVKYDNIGHLYPENLDHLIDQSLKHIENSF